MRRRWNSPPGGGSVSARRGHRLCCGTPKIAKRFRGCQQERPRSVPARAPERIGASLEPSVFFRTRRAAPGARSKGSWAAADASVPSRILPVCSRRTPRVNPDRIKEADGCHHRPSTYTVARARPNRRYAVVRKCKTAPSLRDGLREPEDGCGREIRGIRPNDRHGIEHLRCRLHRCAPAMIPCCQRRSSLMSPDAS